MSRAICPGSVGEVVQGMVGGREVLVSLTVNRFSEMEIVPGGEKPSGLWKSERALEIALEYFGAKELEGKISFRRRRSLPVGKGFASSTADIAALLGALAGFLGKKVREEEIARLALQIEPTDSTFFSGWCLFDHLQGEVFVSLPAPKTLGVVVVELPGEVETLSVDRKRLRCHFELFACETEKSFEMLERGLEEGDLSLLGRAATISSTIMQEYERNEVLDSLLEALWDIRALGINRAHTGRALGVLFDLRIVGLSEAQRRVAEVLEGKEIRLWTARAIGGGVQVVRG